MPDTFQGGRLSAPEPTPQSTTETPKAEYSDVVEAQEVARELERKPYREVFGDITEGNEYKLDFIIEAVKGDDTTMKTADIVEKIKAIERKLGLSWYEPQLERIYRHVKMVKAVGDSLLGGL